MCRIKALVAIASCIGLLSPSISLAYADSGDARLLTHPAVSAKNIAFVYADDMWIADADGKNPRRLTAHQGLESRPVFSPDGSMIAFSAQYDGNTDVFLMPITGGSPKRLTHHPADDVVLGFSPDGKSVLFSSQRNSFTVRYSQFYTVPLEGGMPTQLVIPWGWKASYSPDGKRVAYMPVREVFEQWKNYRGGTHGRIWLFDMATHAIEEIPQPEGRCNDTDPYWVDDKTVLFRSDRNGEFNLFLYHSPAKSVQQITKFSDFPVLNVDVGGGRILFEQAGYLHLLSLPAGNGTEVATTTRLKVPVAADLVETRARYVKGSEYVREANVSPSAARAVFEIRGEIVTVPAEKGDPLNLSRSVAAHDRSPAWSPDGKSIAYFSDVTGEYQLQIQAQNGKTPPRAYKLEGSGFYVEPVWSPDSKKLLYRDNSQALFMLDVETGKINKIVDKVFRSAGGGDRPSSWSPDSKWIAYSVDTPALIQTIYLYSVDHDKSFKITDGLSDCNDPVFDANGKYLYFMASTETGMSKHGFALSSQDARTPRRSLYLAVLGKEIPSPFMPESDEEKGTPPPDEPKKAGSEDGEKDDKDGKKDELAGKGKNGGRGKPKVTVKVDVENILERIVALPLPPGLYAGLQAGPAGQLYFLELPDVVGRRGGPGISAQLKVFDIEKRKVDSKLAAVSSYFVTPDGRKILYRNGRDWFIHGTGPASGGAPTAVKGGGKGRGPNGSNGSNGSPTSAPTSDKRLNLAAVSIKIDPKAEWEQIFNEAWRINRDFFYAPNMHGTNWTEMRDKYRPFLEHAAVRNDVNRIIQWMCSELAVGHHRGGGGDRIYNPETVPGGLLGADYEIVDGRYRFKKIYGTNKWNPGERAPLVGPGINVNVGDFLLAVNGVELKAPTELYQLFENTSGKTVELKVGPTADGQNSRTVQVVPVSDEQNLRNRDWVEGNLRKVHEATKGRVAYVYVPDTASDGLTYFKRYFFPQVDKEAVIIDERFNRGGQLADYYIDTLRRPFTAFWAPRHGADWVTPGAAIFGPKVMIADENAGSGGDLLPWMFRKYKLGTLIGKRTWGGLVGISGYPVLMDGGQITAPSFAIWTEEGWVVENEGVPPDIEVEQTPADVIAGRDPQLEKAIAIIMEELNKNPVKKPQRPPFPIRVRKLPAGGAPQANN